VPVKTPHGKGVGDTGPQPDQRGMTFTQNHARLGYRHSGGWTFLGRVGVSHRLGDLLPLPTNSMLFWPTARGAFTVQSPLGPTCTGCRPVAPGSSR
jgi:hypothetical protein